MIQTTSPLQASVRVHNTGNAFYVSKVAMTVSDIFGGKKYDESKEYTVLPDKPRKVMANWDNVDAIGLYHVSVTAETPSGSQTTYGYVLMVPLWFIALLITAFVGTLVYIKSRKRNSSAHQYRSDRRR